MREVAVQTSRPEKLVPAVIMQLNKGQVEGAIASFADESGFKDHGFGLESTGNERLTEFFLNTQGLYPDYFLQDVPDGNSKTPVKMRWVVVTENRRRQLRICWMDVHERRASHHAVDTTSHYHRAVLRGLTTRIPISLAGVSIVRIREGKIADWADYYDGLTSRRTALGAHFAEWIEYYLGYGQEAKIT